MDPSGHIRSARRLYNWTCLVKDILAKCFKMLDFDLEFLKGVRMRRTWAEAHTDKEAGAEAGAAGKARGKEVA
jgi:hypothetical protein